MDEQNSQQAELFGHVDRAARHCRYLGCMPSKMLFRCVRLLTTVRRRTHPNLHFVMTFRIHSDARWLGREKGGSRDDVNCLLSHLAAVECHDNASSLPYALWHPTCFCDISFLSLPYLEPLHTPARFLRTRLFTMIVGRWRDNAEAF